MTEQKIERRKLAEVAQQWTTNIRPTWSVAQVKSALYRHQLGDFSESALLVDAMMADDELPSCVARAVDTIVGAPFDLVPLKGSLRSEQVAEFASEYWWECFPEDELTRLFFWYLWLGVAVATIDWDTSQTPWKPRLRTLHPQFLLWEPEAWNQATQRYGAFSYQHRGGTELIQPGDGKWVVLTNGRDSWMQASVRAMATAWLVKQFAWRDWQRYNERHGLPILKAGIPIIAKDDRQEYLDDLRSIGSEGVIHLPTGMGDDSQMRFELDLLEAQDQSWDSFQAVIERVDRKFQVHFLGTNSGAELIGTAGSKATSESGRDIAREVAAYRARRITTSMRAQMLWPFASVNIPGVTMADMPWPTYQITEGVDSREQGEGWRAMGEGLQALKNAGYGVENAEEIAEEAGLVLEEKEPEPVPLQGQQPPAEPDEEADDEQSEDETEKLDALPVTVDSVGRREGFVAGQRYLDSLTDRLSEEAESLEAVTAEAMISIVDSASDEADLERRLKEYLAIDDPVMLARLFEKAILLSQLAGRFATQEDL